MNRQFKERKLTYAHYISMIKQNSKKVKMIRFAYGADFYADELFITAIEESFYEYKMEFIRSEIPQL